MCKSIFTVPKQLSCLHSFCLHCLNQVLRTNERKDHILCPECRREVKVPRSRNFNELPTNFYINSLLDVLAVKECSAIGVRCGNCDKKSPQSFYCFQCCSFWCEDCLSRHNSLRINEEHRVLAITDFQDEDMEAMLKRPAYCQLEHHEKEELKYFCESCQVGICCVCAVTEHSDGHVKVILEEAANERKKHVKSVIECQRQGVDRNREKINKIGENCVQIQEQVLSMKRKVEGFVDRVVEALEEKKKEVFSNLEKQQEESLKRLQNQQRTLEHHVRFIETKIQRAETLINRSTDAEIVLIDADFQEEISDEQEQLVCDLESFRHFVFKENETLLQIVTVEGIGSIGTFPSKTEVRQSTAWGKGTSEATVALEAELFVSARNSKGQVGDVEFDPIEVEIRNNQGQACTTEPQIQYNGEGTYKISYFAKETGICQASVKINREHVLGSPFSVQFKPRQYKPMFSFGEYGSSTGRFNSPWGLAVNGRDEILVTETRNNRVQVFRSDGAYLTAFSRNGSRKGELNFPTEIACDANENIFVVDCNNHRINKFDNQGKFLCQIGSKGMPDVQLKHPRGISVDSNGNIIVTDTGNRQIKLFSPSGELLRKIDGEGALVKPYGVVERNGKVLVSDTEDHFVKVFDVAGKFLYKFGGEGQRDGEFNQPRGLSFDKTGHLMVCDSENNRVQLFKLNGEFVGKFGTQGSGNGGFNKPVNTAVLSDGRIVVSDFYNHAIHVFE